MNEQERAEIVARAIDALLAGADADTIEGHHNEDLQSLLDIAEERLVGSVFIAKASIQHEREVWQAVVKRIQDAEIEAIAASPGAEDEELEELGEVIALRRRLAAEVSALGESHKAEVWNKIQSRLANRTTHTGLPDFLRPFRRRSDAERPSKPPVLDTYVPEMLPVPGVRPRALMGQMAVSTQGMARARVWARVASSAGFDDTRIEVKPHRRRMSVLSAFGVAAAVAAIAALAIGPLPATGFAHHPATRLAAAIGSYLGAQGSAPPDVTNLPSTIIVEGRSARAAQASALAGVSFGEPPSAPAGFQLDSSTYHPAPISGGGPGAFVLSYSSSDGGLTIYQEAAGGYDSAVSTDSMTSVALSDGTPATLVQGSWLADEGLSWSASGSQSLIFQRAGVLVVIELLAADPRPGLLFQVADSIQ
jgi:hypothetical protein